VVEVLSLYFDAFRAKFLERPDSFMADVSLGGLRVNDGTTPESLFPQIVRVKDAPETVAKIQMDVDEDGNETRKSLLIRFSSFNSRRTRWMVPVTLLLLES
jgi:vacuolar protein sorting-associated protein 13A/C